MFIILRVVIVSWVYTYDKTHQVIYYKYVQIIVSPAYLVKAVKKKAGNLPLPTAVASSTATVPPHLPLLCGEGKQVR